ncbi:hypothetical protein MKJ01_15055 [Chryseobacterium sp. SSA4.19]|uniref:hypothetical protein n=1 Tax=Chryseobacterium sp. SSA4.19 TaxID=2919915 RepID=UPI001F4ED7F7|nr:hypothetical protein [Chryseobacterium sp. SSA4.19]MCJ8155085.1 hypothetical protein [Chryseobacterium sp. SSA4.19]
MKNGFIIFWGAFIAYFIFIHPCIIYYNVPHSSNNTPNGMLALFFLALSCILWGASLGYTLWLILKNSFLAKKNLTYIEQSGRRVQAIIKESKLINKHQSGPVSREIVLDINNFSGHDILHSMIIRDTRPEENRFETGKIIYLKVDDTFKRNPYLFLEGSQAKVNYLLFLVWGIFLAGVIAYYRYAYATESGGLGWRFLELFHPLLVIPACLIFFPGIMYLIFKIFIMGNKTTREQLRLKFWGQKAMADIISVRQTGTYINEQPQIEFVLEFKDKMGKLIKTSKKEIVDLLNLGNVSSMKQREILYLPDNPENFSFFDEINN